MVVVRLVELAALTVALDGGVRLTSGEHAAKAISRGDDGLASGRDVDFHADVGEPQR